MLYTQVLVCIGAVGASAPMHASRKSYSILFTRTLDGCIARPRTPQDIDRTLTLIFD